jgi:hypothetical protein
MTNYFQKLMLGSNHSFQNLKSTKKYKCKKVYI